ncbi:MAG: porphobilinogen synthase, partial [Candidatus Margulisiibacteriota bacterium]
MKLKTRMRRIRQNPILREMFKETGLLPRSFVMPYFIREGFGVKKEISSMPGIFQLSKDNAVKQIKEDLSLGIKAVILFGIPKSKDGKGSGAFDPDGVIQDAVKMIKDKVPLITVITDVCLCEYTDHGHCGIVKKQGKKFVVDNDSTLRLLTKTAVSHAKAGADMVAPSAMMDGMVGAIREGLDENGFSNLPIMAYSAK